MLAVLASITCLSLDAFTQTTTVFSGAPSVKISEAGFERVPERLDSVQGADLACVISRVGDKYYWASRENQSMVRIESEAFITFVAVNGSGYVRVTIPEMKDSVSGMGETEKRFDYVEHLLIGLKSVTYYGTAR
jgi:hypothetical protein